MDQQKISLWLSRSLRAQAEAQKFHLLMAVSIAVGNKAGADKSRITSDKFNRAVPKLMKMAVKYGWNPDGRKDEKEDRDRI